MAAVFAGRLPGRMVPVPQLTGEGYGRGMALGLVDDAVAFGEPHEGGDRVRIGVGFEIETQADGFETDGHLRGHPEGAAEIEIALRPDTAAVDPQVHGGGHGHEGHTGTRGRCFEQHVAGAGLAAIAAGGGVPSAWDACLWPRGTASNQTQWALETGGGNPAPRRQPKASADRGASLSSGHMYDFITVRKS
jgi:hypothetical protein